MRKQALAESEAAVELRPNDKKLRQFRDDLKQLAANAANSVPAAFPTPEPAPKEPGEVEVNPESLSLFVTKVQPILMNLCATCHATGRGGDFKLTRTYSTTALGQRTTQANLVATMPFLNREQPESSPLLIKATTAHGEATAPPVRDHQAPAYRHLDDWVHMALGQPLLPPPAAVASPARPPAISPALLLPNTPGKDGDMPFQAVSSPDSKSPPTKAEEKPNPMPATPTPPAEKPKATPSDPFDPLIFNRQMHPEKKDK
jgi:hypothetical protein